MQLSNPHLAMINPLRRKHLWFRSSIINIRSLLDYRITNYIFFFCNSSIMPNIVRKIEGNMSFGSDRGMDDYEMFIILVCYTLWIIANAPIIFPLFKLAARCKRTTSEICTDFRTISGECTVSEQRIIDSFGAVNAKESDSKEEYDSDSDQDTILSM